MKIALPKKSCYIEVKSSTELKNLEIVINSIKSGLFNASDIIVPCQLYYNSKIKNISLNVISEETLPVFSIEQFIDNIIMLEKNINVIVNGKKSKIKLDSDKESATLISDLKHEISFPNLEKIFKFANRSPNHPFKGKYLYLRDHDEWEIAYQFIKKMNWKIDAELVKENTYNLKYNKLSLDDTNSLNSHKSTYKKYGEIALPIIACKELDALSLKQIDFIDFLKLVKSNDLSSTISVNINNWHKFSVMVDEKIIKIGCKNIDKDNLFTVYSELKEMIEQK